VRSKIPAETARDFAVLPLQLRDEGRTLVVAVADPLNVRHLDELRAVTKCRIVPNVAGRTSIARAYARLYEENAELADADTNFKVMDAHGRTVIKNMKDGSVQQVAVPPRPGQVAPPPPPPRPSGEAPAVRPASSGSPTELLKTVEEVQRKEVAALKAMVELLIEKGIFTREEYLAKVKR
jgi:hypothetical protein